jgi:hypothetical protein
MMGHLMTKYKKLIMNISKGNRILALLYSTIIISVSIILAYRIGEGIGKVMYEIVN